MKTQLLFYLDDDSDDLYLFKEAAIGLGHRVSLFRNGNEMIYALRYAPEKPDVIFLDVHMPILNGEEMLSILKKSEEFKEIPVVMISGAFPKKLVRDYLKNGANYLMKKPVSNELKAMLAKVLEIDFTTFFHAFN